ncbi:MAG: GMC family oxidoreductase [Gallionellaceae bacterium]|nr:GMC family oxidoreductase [Gallionellaceae bacterium]MDD5367236.1 GMC family oxidoreductase [Gallionellaceae bacterium]
MTDYDVCVIGSGAGGGPVAYTLAQQGRSVVVLEKGPWFTEADFYKDELACCRRSVYTPDLKDEQHVIEDTDEDGDWVATPTSESGWNFWNGNCVGGSSNFMSGFFHRMKPVDFRLRSEFGAIAGANIVDWPITYKDLEPWYDKVEKIVGVSGKLVCHANIEPRSSPDFPYPPTAEHPVSGWIDTACGQLGYHALKVPRAILSQPADGRRGCEYSGYCGSYGCSSGAKGSSRAALLDHAVASGHCQVRPHAKVHKLISDAKGRVVAAEYFDRAGQRRRVTAKVFVVACQAIESARLLLASTGPRFPKGLANNHGQVGRNLLFSAGGAGGGDLVYGELSEARAAELRVMGPFINRALDDWYVIDDPALPGGRAKGGIVEFLFSHPNPIARASGAKSGEDGLVWGKPLKRRLESWLRDDRRLAFEVFDDWLPVDSCFVTLDKKVRDRWGDPVARVRIGHHDHSLKIGRYLAEKAEKVLQQVGARNISSSIGSAPPANLVAGGCRFGTDPATSVLDPDCRAHEVANLYVSDGSFMPTGGSVPYTWTIYANAFRVADRIAASL